MAKFEIGEIAIAIGESLFRGECEIISERYEYEGYMGYDVIFPDNPCHSYDSYSGEWFADENDLRKKQPPQELSSWESIEKLTGWSPLKENEHVY